MGNAVRKLVRFLTEVILSRYSVREVKVRAPARYRLGDLVAPDGRV